MAAKRLPGELAKMGWSGRDLERRAGFANGYISKVCRGMRQPSADFAGRIEKLLGKRMVARLWSEFVSS